MRITEDFDAFVAIVEAGSISEAARVIDVPRATLSRQLTRLERRLGTRLLHRTTRRLVPTAAGERLYERARVLIDAAEAALDSVQRLDDVPRGRLRVSMPPLTTPLFGRLFAEFMGRHPEVTVELLATSEHVDLVGRHVDVALRGGIVQASDLIARPLLRTELLAVASPRYLEQVGPIDSVQALERAEHVRGFDGGTRPTHAWPLHDGGSVAVRGRFATNDIMAQLGAVLSGLGVGLLPGALVDAELERGGVVAVLPGVVGRAVSLSAVWVEREFIEPKVRAFVEFAVEWASAGRLLL
ncbi:MAG: LysR family transcriptional regulator [Nannocystaceae bacterium]|nr:LysR family transcriptional regulator [bacterium]